MTDFKQDHPEGIIMAMDQMSLYFQATTTRVSARWGQTPTLRFATQREHAHFYGAVNACSGQESALTLPIQSGEMACHFLDHLQSIYPGRALLLLWGRAQWHKGSVVRDYLSQQGHIQSLHFSPGSPELNPQEHVWQLTRDAVSHNHTRKTFPALVQAFRRNLENMCFNIDWVEKCAPAILLAT